MTHRLVPTLLLLVTALNAQGQEKLANSRIVSVGLFKNGLAVVTREVEISKPGTYLVEDLPQPVHGTFWIESTAEVEARMTLRETERPIAATAPENMQQDWAGKEVLIRFRADIPLVSGKVMKLAPRNTEKTRDRTYRPANYYHPGYITSTNPRPQQSYLILETDDGRVYLDISLIAYARIKNAKDTVLEKRPVLLLTVGEKKQPLERITLKYLTKGMAWAPSYRVDITDAEELTIEQKAVIKNELADMEDAELWLISGFPSVKFGHVTSPLSLQTTWTQFFNQLNTEPRRSGSCANVLMQQAIASNASVTSSSIDLSAIPANEGPDVHYQSIGKQTLAEGDSLMLSVASAKAEYERLVEWIVPDTRSANGQHIGEWERRQNPEEYQDAAWDAIRFKNPLSFPMTTASAMIEGGDRFHGQCISYWVNMGEQTTLHITKALSIRTRNTEHEEQEKREVVYVAGEDYQKTVVKGELTLSNHRNEKVKIVIRRRFSGELIKADDDPKCALREEGVWSVNKRNELTWELVLKAGEKKTLAYRYSILVDR